MKVKNWLIHKLGGKTQEEISPPIQYTAYRPKIETIRAEFVDRGIGVPQDYIEEVLAHNLMLLIKDYMKIKETIIYPGEKLYVAKINIVEMEE